MYWGTVFIIWTTLHLLLWPQEYIFHSDDTVAKFAHRWLSRGILFMRIFMATVICTTGNLPAAQSLIYAWMMVHVTTAVMDSSGPTYEKTKTLHALIIVVFTVGAQILSALIMSPISVHWSIWPSIVVGLLELPRLWLVAFLSMNTF